MLRAGCSGYLLKGSVSDELLLAIRAAHRGAAYFSPAISASIMAVGTTAETHPKAGAPNRRTRLNADPFDQVESVRLRLER